MDRLPINQVLLLALLYFVWTNPSVISDWGLVLGLSLVGGFMMAQLFIIAIEYLLIRYGANKSGVMFLATVLCITGCIFAYISWIQNNYTLLNISWIIIYTSFGVLRAAYKQKLSKVVRDMILHGEYLLIALFAAALFQTYIHNSPISTYNLDYAGIDGEMVWFIAMIILVADIVYKLSLELIVSGKKIVRKNNKEIINIS